ncbi:MAG: CocE/NonD family hydrolase [Deltaproteobacteria bacterium]|nr:CocE/NonD family hydrolase [Deltaproteobacteria bacterium]
MRFVFAVATFALLRSAAANPTPPNTPDIPATFVPPAQQADFDTRDVMIPMRDGVKLHAVIVVPKGATRAPILLTRTPYNAGKKLGRTSSTSMAASLPVDDDVFAADGNYIRVYEDVRGKYGSEGDYVMTRPLKGPLNPTPVDHSTDTYDTIDWLVKNVKETNGRVGMIGSSYDGFTVLMALVHPHPALKAAVPECPMVDGWMGDDWMHYGAFRNINLDYFAGQTEQRGEGKGVPRPGLDDYETFLRAGSTGDYAKAAGFEQLPFWKKIAEHPAYDAFWQEQALDTLLAKEPLTVPTLIVASEWDQEDKYGWSAVYKAFKGRALLLLGPWPHSGAKGNFASFGPLQFDGDTAVQARRDVIKPFLDEQLKDKAPKSGIAPVTVFETGTMTWRKQATWPAHNAPRALYFGGDGHASFDAPKGEGFDEYVSDPQKPVPYVPRPVKNDHDQWRKWLVVDQRFVVDRPDVLSFVTEPLKEPLHISGQAQVDLFASTTGTDSDWVVKLIDVYPEEYAPQPELGGYELGIAMDIFRGRYRDSFEHPTAIPAGQVQRYRFALPDANHVFGKGHRIMVQVQSSWFPLYDRNPQTFVENMFFAKPGDYKKATQRVYHQPGAASAVVLPVAR